MDVRGALLRATASGRSHSVPVFEGPQSRLHRRRDLRHLTLSAWRATWREGAWGDADTLVLFAGFPRSGHSLLGAALDSHPGAVVSHELDAAGLFEAGMRAWEVAALIRLHAAAFRDSGQTWNGYSYAVPDQLPRAEAKVLGDKKGDWLVRRALSDPGLVDRIRDRIAPRRLAIVGAIRNPFDNVATLSLRKGRHYDRLKIEARAKGAATDAAALLAADDRQRIPRDVLSEMVDDYARLCEGLDALREAVPPRDWLTLRHEDLVAAPVAELSRLFRFLNLEPVEAPARRAAAIVSEAAHSTRHVVGWNDEARERITGLCRTHDFLKGYAFDTPDARRRPYGPGQPTGGLETVHVITAVGLQGDQLLLPHFLDHYCGLGIPAANIHAILNAPIADPPELPEVRRLLSERGCAEPEVWIGPYSSREMWQRRRELQVHRTGADDWVISADVDELHVYPEGIAPVLAQMNVLSADLLQGPLIDRLAPGGRLAAVTASPSLFEQFPVEGDLMCQISRWPDRRDQGGTIKVMLMSAAVLPGLGGHGIDMAETRARAQALVATGNDLPKGKGVAERLARQADGRIAYLHGAPLNGDPRIKDPGFRLSFPIYVAHFKWRAGLGEELERRSASGLATAAATRYADLLQGMLKGPDGDRGIDLGLLAPLTSRQRRLGWQGHTETLRRQSETAKTRRKTTAPTEPATAEAGWRLRQLTFGSAAGIGHFHSYYDLPVIAADGRSIAAVRFDRPQRPLVAEDSVEVGVVDVEETGFRPLARTSAWSWQQGPMLQWLQAEDRLVWNEREGDRFVGIVATRDGEIDRTFDRPVYALDPAGTVALSLNFARLDLLRPGYGYAGGAGARLEDIAPEDDGIWMIDVATGRSELILSLARGVETLRRILSDEERNEHEREGYRYWFNHCKISPDGTRFTVKLRWRRPDGPWTGLMGVSLTCGMNGSDPRVIVRAASHVMWHDPSHLYFWNQGDRFFARKPDVELVEPLDCERLVPEEFNGNIHVRHLPDDPARMIYDVPYKPVVELREVDLRSGEVRPIATFPGHVPAKGPYRCDLHPVPSRDGNRIVVSAMSDGARQVYVLDRDA